MSRKVSKLTGLMAVTGLLFIFQFPIVLAMGVLGVKLTLIQWICSPILSIVGILVAQLTKMMLEGTDEQKG